jgi:hypothetical protein
MTKPLFNSIGNFHFDNPRSTRCPVCKHESVEGCNICFQLGEEITEFCGKCFAKFIAQHVPKMEIISEK